MDILLCSHYFHPHIGGIESVVESHAKGLAERGHDVTVVSSDVGADSQTDQRDGYDIRRFEAWNPIEAFGAPYPLPNPRNVRRRLREAAVDSNVDVVHLHGLNYVTTTAMLHYIPSDCPVVMHQHTPFVEYPFPLWIVEYLNDHTVGRWNLRQADLVFCVNASIEQYVREIEPGTNTELLMNGIDTDVYTPSRAGGSDTFACSPETPVFFALSRMSQKKGVDVLLEAIATVNREGVDAHFAVAGDGPLREDVDQAARSNGNVEVLGKLSDDELAECYATADAFVFTSKSGEAFPTLTMIEAYASGTPVIASELAPDPVGVRDGENTILVEPGRPDELAGAIGRLATEPELMAEMGAEARKTAEQVFAIERRIDRLESCYESLIESHSGVEESF
jgi:glycosyltransferase involved in cell wall biosynthesis